MDGRVAGVVVWDVDGTLIPADLRWLRRAIAQTYELTEASVVFPAKKVHGYTDKSIVVDAAVASGVSPAVAEAGVQRFGDVMSQIMARGRDEVARVQPAYPGAAESITALHRHGFVQTVLTGNLRSAAEVKLQATGLDHYIDFSIGGYGSDTRDRFSLPPVVAGRYRVSYGHDLEPARTVVIGDAPNDIACARSAGFRVVVVTHRASREELTQSEPDAILGSLDPDDVVETVTSLVRSA